MANRDPKYEQFEGFLRAVLTSYWDSRGRDRTRFIALLLASREAWGVALDAFTASPRKIATGAAGAAAVAVALRVVLGGPLGLLLTGASAASLIALFVRRRQRIATDAERYRGLIQDYRSRFERVQEEYVDGAIDRDRRNLLVDGLMRRLLEDIDGSAEPERSQSNGFADHVSKRRHS